MSLDSRPARDTAGRLLRDVVAPLALGGAIAPGAAVGPADVRAIHDERPVDLDPELAIRVDGARLRRARALVPVDAVRPIGPADWALAAAVQDILKAADPALDRLLRRHGAEALLGLAGAILDRLAAPATLGEAVARHSWLARLLEVRRTDTRVSWWSGSRTFLGRAPPRRLTTWPDMRRVAVEQTHRAMFEWSPLAVSPSTFAGAVARLLSLSPLTDLATCARDGDAPAFAWSASLIALVATRAGRTLAFRALAAAERDPNAVDAALGRATRELVATGSVVGADSVLLLLAERAMSQALRAAEGDPSARVEAERRARRNPVAAVTAAADVDARLARALGALTAARALDPARPSPIVDLAPGSRAADRPDAPPPDRPDGFPFRFEARARIAEALATTGAASPEAQRILRVS